MRMYSRNRGKCCCWVRVPAKTGGGEIRPDPESHVTPRGGRGQTRAACYHGVDRRKGVSPASRYLGKKTYRLPEDETQ